MTEQVLALITALSSGAFTLVWKWVKQRLTPAQISGVMSLAHVAVSAAERIGEGIEEITGADKYAVASQYLVAAAKRFGVKLKPEEVNGYIHAALREMEAMEQHLDLSFAHPDAPAA